MHVSALEKGTNNIFDPTRVPGLSISLIVSSKTSIERRRRAHCLRGVRRPPPDLVFGCTWHDRLRRERRTDVHSSAPLLYKTASLNLQSRHKLDCGMVSIRRPDPTAVHSFRLHFDTHNFPCNRDLDSLVAVVDRGSRHRRSHTNPSLILRLIDHVAIMTLPDDLRIARV